MAHITILGEGAWGTAIATVLAHNGHRVKLWCHDAQVARAIENEHVNHRYMPGVVLSDLIEPSSSLQEAVSGAHWICEAIPVAYLRSVLQQVLPFVSADQQWIVLSKGIEQHTLKFPTQIIDDVLQCVPTKAVLAGPTFAHELAHKKISAATIAFADCEIGVRVKQLFETDYLKTYISTDQIGVQAGSALKNVIALAIGMLDGAGYGQNAKACMLTRGLHEIVVLCTLLGGRAETVYGLSGVGDLVLTAMGTLSKNMHVGQMLAQGKSVDEILQTTGFIPEGINTVESVHLLMQKYQVDLPLCRLVAAVIHKKMSVQDLVTQMMNQHVLQECEF